MQEFIDYLFGQGSLGVFCALLLVVAWYLERRRTTLITEKEELYKYILQLQSNQHKELVEVLQCYKDDQHRFDELLTMAVGAIGQRRR